MTAYLSTECFILRAQDYKESDQFLTVYAAQTGKMRLLAKGVKKSASRLRGGLLLFSLTHLTMTVGTGISVVTNAETKTAYMGIRNDFQRMSYASYCAELLDALLEEEERDSDLFTLVENVFAMLENGDAWLACRLLEFHLLRLLGYQIQLDHCLNCETPLPRGKVLRGIVGGILCPTCPIQELQRAIPLSVETQTVLRAFEKKSWEQMKYLRISKQCKMQLEDYLELQLQQVLDRSLKTKAFLKNMHV